ncbi:MAG TPA: MTH1187 family thiamine-binding protein [Chthonomonadales bacterium]|nr:MTH1187 family thiamine-binding protein [Chthonomonadales bacterium]
MLASFSVVPIGVGEELKEKIAELVPLIEQSGLDYTMGAMQTTVEGDPEKVLALIMACHRHMRSAAPRVLTHVTIDDREGAAGRLRGKVQDVESVLGRSVNRE